MKSDSEIFVADKKSPKKIYIQSRLETILYDTMIHYNWKIIFLCVKFGGLHLGGLGSEHLQSCKSTDFSWLQEPR